MSTTNASAYDIRGDIDLDGDVDSTDKTEATAYGAATMGWGGLSWVGSLLGFAGYRDRGLLDARDRFLAVTMGRWIRRDSLAYADGLSVYAYSLGNSLANVDPYGTTALSVHEGGGEGEGGSYDGFVLTCLFRPCLEVMQMPDPWLWINWTKGPTATRVVPPGGGKCPSKFEVEQDLTQFGLRGQAAAIAFALIRLNIGKACPPHTFTDGSGTTQFTCGCFGAWQTEEHPFDIPKDLGATVNVPCKANRISTWKIWGEGTLRLRVKRGTCGAQEVE